MSACELTGEGQVATKRFKHGGCDTRYSADGARLRCRGVGGLDYIAPHLLGERNFFVG